MSRSIICMKNRKVNSHVNSTVQLSTSTIHVRDAIMSDQCNVLFCLRLVYSVPYYIYSYPYKDVYYKQYYMYII